MGTEKAVRGQPFCIFQDPVH